MLSIWMAAAGARATEGFGLGGIVGEPTGVSAKMWVTPRQALDAAAAWSFSDNGGFQLHADYLFHQFEWLKLDPATGRMPVYFGVGARVKLKEGNDPSGQDNGDDLADGTGEDSTDESEDERGNKAAQKDNSADKGEEDETVVGIRFPLGIAFLFAKAPIEIFAEIAPILDVAPDTDFDIHAAIGARFYFH
ncbi:MAG TPA: hypothetical protein DCM68_01060 [Verrucomicrobia bacterium]|nr:hypothetical protein [Verrucomicrobiota bacterium]